MTSEDALDLVHQTTRVLGSGSSRVGRVAVLIGDTSSGVLSAGQASLGIRVAVGASGGGGVVVKVTRGAVSRNTAVLVVGTRGVDASGRSVDVESVSARGSGEVTAGNSLVSGSTLVSSESCGSVLTEVGTRVTQAGRVFGVGGVVACSSVGTVLTGRSSGVVASARELRSQSRTGVVRSVLGREVVSGTEVGVSSLL